ncbi:MAG: FecR domain-containing protein [bacterium]|nr:FecR domain-containing protein [bacterium]
MTRSIAAFFIAALLLGASPASAETFAGLVSEVTGNVTVMSAGQKAARPLKLGDGLTQGDAVATGKDSRVQIEFADNSVLVVSQNGRVLIDKYVYDAKKPKQGTAEFTILDTAFSYVSGLMDKNPKPDVKMHLNFGTMGIRGTKLTRAMAKGQCWIYLEEGVIDVYNNGGKVTLMPGDGTTMRGTDIAPAMPVKFSPKNIAWMKRAASGVTYKKQAE